MIRSAIARAAVAALLSAVCLPAFGGDGEASAESGEALYKRYCVTCHGAKADGTGAAARLFSPPPADLTRSERPDEYKQLIIRVGGGAMGRSTGMPPWGEELSDTQIHDVVRYLATLKTVKTVRP